MPQAKRSRPGFEPPRPTKKKASGTIIKSNHKSSDQSNKKRSRPSKRDASRSRATSASDEGSASPRTDDEESNAESDSSTNDRNNSPEPDYILAEVTHEGVEARDNIMSLPLLHRILQEHFQDKDKTKITTDARHLIGKYIDIFVREAIMRSAYERNERDKENGTEGASSGWLEVEDLERIAPQLCMDF